jgi:hypothetical protein
MPEPVFIVRELVASGRWGERIVSGAGWLELHVDAGHYVLDDAEPVVIAYDILTDATWERETLTLHRGGQRLELRGPRELNRAWGLVIERACALPEVALGLRMLGSGRGGSAALQGRFFGPLLQVRRSLQEPDAIDRRVARLDAAALEQRFAAAVMQLAAERFPADAPHRRSLEAHLEEAIEPLVAQIGVLGSASEALRAAGEGNRFVAWRAWTVQLRRVFLEADRSWSLILRHLEPR